MSKMLVPDFWKKRGRFSEREMFQAEKSYYSDNFLLSKKQ